MIGKIAVLNFRTSCIIGEEQEWKKEQPVSVDIEVEADFSKCYGMKTTEKTVDWIDIAQGAERLLKGKKYILAETAVVDIAKLVLRNPFAKTVTVQLCKMEPAVAAEKLCAEIRLSASE